LSLNRAARVQALYKDAVNSSTGILKVVNDAANLDKDVEDCIYEFPFTKALSEPNNHDTHCFRYSHMLFAASNKQTCMQLCRSFRKLFLPPSKATLTCAFGCGATFPNMLALLLHQEARITTGECSFFPYQAQDNNNEESVTVFISNVTQSAYFVRDKACEILDQTPTNQNGERFDLLNPLALPYNTGSSARQYSEHMTHDLARELNNMSKTRGSYRSTLWSVVKMKLNWLSENNQMGENSNFHDLDFWFLPEIVQYCFLKPFVEWPAPAIELVRDASQFGVETNPDDESVVSNQEQV